MSDLIERVDKAIDQLMHLSYAQEQLENAIRKEAYNEGEEVPRMRRDEDNESTQMGRSEKVLHRVCGVPLVWPECVYKKGVGYTLEFNEKEVQAEALLKPCRVCGCSPVLVRDIYGIGDSMVFYVTCDNAGSNHGRKIRLYTCAEDAIKGWNARGGE